MVQQEEEGRTTDLLKNTEQELGAPKHEDAGTPGAVVKLLHATRLPARHSWLIRVEIPDDQGKACWMTVFEPETKTPNQKGLAMADAMVRVGVGGEATLVIANHGTSPVQLPEGEVTEWNWGGPLRSNTTSTLPTICPLSKPHGECLSHCEGKWSRKNSSDTIVMGEPVSRRAVTSSWSSQTSLVDVCRPCMVATSCCTASSTTFWPGASGVASLNFLSWLVSPPDAPYQHGDLCQTCRGSPLEALCPSVGSHRRSDPLLHSFSRCCHPSRCPSPCGFLAMGFAFSVPPPHRYSPQFCVPSRVYGPLRSGPCQVAPQKGQCTRPPSI